MPDPNDSTPLLDAPITFQRGDCHPCRKAGLTTCIHNDAPITCGHLWPNGKRCPYPVGQCAVHPGAPLATDAHCCTFVQLKCEMCDAPAVCLSIPGDPGEGARFACGECCGCAGSVESVKKYHGQSARLIEIAQIATADDVRRSATRDSDLEVLNRIAEIALGQIVPLPMILHCPKCHGQHIDRKEWATSEKSHKTHLCEHCKHLFRPANVPTVGVEEL